MPWLFVLATVLFWGGAAALVFGGARFVASLSGPDAARTKGAALAGGGLLAIVVSVLLRGSPNFGLPVFWPVLSVQLWLATVTVVFAFVSVVKAFSDDGPGRRQSHVRNALLWAAVTVGVTFLPRANSDPPRFLTGQIHLSPVGLAWLVVFAALAVGAMAWSAKSARGKEVFRAVSTQIALLVGCVVFGLPFLFLLVTSFKEDRDMSNKDGIVWVPRVEQTMPVDNPAHPYYEARYHGLTVKADLDKENPDGTLSLRIERPAYYGGYSFNVPKAEAKRVPRDMPLVTATFEGQAVKGVVFEKLPDGSEDVQILEPASMKGRRHVFAPRQTEHVRPVSLRWRNYVEALEFLPPEALYGLTYLKNTLWLVVMNVAGALISGSLVAYAFARLRFPGKELLFTLMLSTMMLPAAVTLLPQFLIFRSLGWIDSLKPMWVTSWFAAAFNVFLLRQFFMQVPYELEDAAKIDGCGYLRSLWSVMLPQVKPALAVIAIMTFLGAWNNFMGPLVYSSSPETMPVSYAVQLFNGERNGEPGLLTAFVTMSVVPVIALFAFAQRFFIEGVTLSGLGGR
ncbi:MAG: carbohydrate ABC transporter permease [Armatimonadetes bacterium]|nr:carbohydrate ABC transporter permease [Armatimonadota bacterium]